MKTFSTVLIIAFSVAAAGGFLFFQFSQEAAAPQEGEPIIEGGNYFENPESEKPEVAGGADGSQGEEAEEGESEPVEPELDLKQQLSLGAVKAVIEKIGVGVVFDVLRIGGCGEVVAAHFTGAEVDKENLVNLGWDSRSIDKLAIFKKISGPEDSTDENDYKAVFVVDKRNVLNQDNQKIVEQVEAEYGYGFGLTEENGYWFIDLIILDENRKGASDNVTFYWDNNECGYAILVAGEPI